MNNCSFMINLCADPEVKTGQSGINYVAYSGAVSGKKEGEDPTFIRCKSFGGTAEYLANYCYKGDRLIVHGSYEPWKSSEGNTVPEFIINSVEVVNHKQQGQTPQQMQTPQQAQAPRQTQTSQQPAPTQQQQTPGGFFNYSGRRQQAGGR